MNAERWLRPGLLAAFAGLILAVSGCADDDTGQKGPKAVPQFSGDAIPGSIYFSAGTRPADADLYRAHGSLSNTQRLTKEARISVLSGNPSVLVASRAPGFGGDQLFQLDVTGDDPLRGKRLDPAGQSPAVSPSGKILYQTPLRTDDGADEGFNVYVLDRLGAKRRLVYHGKALRESQDFAWGPRDTPALLSSKPNGGVTLDPGTRRARQLDVGLPSVYSLDPNRAGGYFATGPGDRVSISADGGKPRVAVTKWLPLTWSPDGRSILSVRGDRLGLMSPSDGTAKRIGTLKGIRVATAVWLAR